MRSMSRLPNAVECHDGNEPRRYRTTKLDRDGDGDLAEGIASEIDALHGVLGEAIGVYASEVIGTPIVYSDHDYPYFFTDTNANAAADADEIARANAYKSWSPRLLKAAYNYQFVGKDRGAFAHNPHYTLQVLIDSIEDLAQAAQIDAPAMARP